MQVYKCARLRHAKFPCSWRRYGLAEPPKDTLCECSRSSNHVLAAIKDNQHPFIAEQSEDSR